MRSSAALFLGCLTASSLPSMADRPEAAFLGSRTYAAATDCPKLQRVAAAAANAKLPDSLPKTLSAKGFAGPGELCVFTNIVERYADRLWTVTMTCTAPSHSQDMQRTQVWRRQSDGSLLITELRDVSTWIACVPERAQVAPPQKRP